MSKIIDIRTQQETLPTEAHKAKRLYQHYTIANLLTKAEMEVNSSPEVQMLHGCISFWERRKVRGIMAFFYISHNLHCKFRADGYRKQLNKLLTGEKNEKLSK